MLKTINGKKDASASVVDGKLILSFPYAHTPVVWQMDLAQVKASSLEVLHNEDAGLYTLTMKTPKGEKIDAAQFSVRSDAVGGLMAASKALENAHGRIHQHAEGQSIGTGSMVHIAKPQRKRRWVMVVVGLFVVFILFNLWVAMIPREPGSFQQSAVAPQAQTPADTAGVPMSADDFLSNQ